MTAQSEASRSAYFKKEASQCNNDAWTLIEQPSLEPDDIVRLVTLAATARHYWHAEGTANNVAHADLLFAWALARAGASAASNVLADSVLSFFTEEGEAWELAFAQAAKAAACAANGDSDGHKIHYAKAEEVGGRLAGPDAQYFSAAFKTVPRPDADLTD
ncbi:MAG: hypothetical protein AAF414_21820 [Pseudomonadota bacterium]